MARMLNNAVFTATSGGTGDFTVSSALTGYQTPAAAGASDGQTYRYRAESGDKAQWEIGTTVASSSGTGFTRTVVASSAGGTTKVNFSDPPTVAIVPMAADFLQFDQSQTLTQAQKDQALANLGLSSGYIVDSAYAEYKTYGTFTAAIPGDNTIPQSSEGTELLNASITPKSTTNKLRVRFTMQATCSASDNLMCAAFLNGETDARAARYQVITAASLSEAHVLEFEFTPGSTSSQTIHIRIGPSNGANTVYVNGGSGGRVFGGVQLSSLVIEEIKA